MRPLHCIWALALIVAPLGWSAHAQGVPAESQASQSAPETAGYVVFLRGSPIGRENVTIQTDDDGVTIVSEGRISAVAAPVTQRADFRYATDWTPVSFELEGTIDGGPIASRTTFRDGSAVTEGASGTGPVSVTHEVSPRTVILPNGVFGAYQALTSQLTGASAGTAFHAYVVPMAEIAGRVVSVSAERMQVGTRIFDIRRYEVVFANPGEDLTVRLTAAEDGSLIGVGIAAEGIEVVRDDIAASTSRTQIHSNPGDEAVIIPAEGFNIGATLTRPANGAGRLPAVILMGGVGVDERDGFELGLPVLGQLAGATAEAGFLTLRYDKRGYGQSGGRAESATLSDHADDVRALVRWLRNRQDVDRNRIAVAGHAEGAWVAMLAAARERRITAVISLAGPSTSGAELMLDRQQRALDRLDLAPAERQRRVELQQRIHSAVLTGKGWEDVPPEMRSSADTPLFQSLLAFEPARAANNVRQPLLVVHGALDEHVPVAQADQLAQLARRSRSVELVVVRGVDHALVPAAEPGTSDDPALRSRTVSGDVTMAVTSWLAKTFAPDR